MKNSQELFDHITGLSSKYSLIGLYCHFENNGETIEIKTVTSDFTGEEEDWYQVSFGADGGSELVDDCLMNISWERELPKDLKNGIYQLTVLLELEHDSDDYRHWSYYSLVHVEHEYVCSIEDTLKEVESMETTWEFIDW